MVLKTKACNEYKIIIDPKVGLSTKIIILFNLQVNEKKWSLVPAFWTMRVFLFERGAEVSKVS